MSRVRVIAALTALSVLCLVPTAHASFDSLPAESLVTNGPVQAMAVSGETLYLGGSFSTIGPATGLGVLFNAELSSRDTATPQVSGLNGVIETSISDGAGGWYVGGKFTSVGGVARSDLVHILANDTVDSSFNPEPDGPVKELALSGSTLYVGGEFEMIAGQSRNGLAALSTSSGAATAFDPKAEPSGSYYGSFLCGLAVDGSYIFVCGAFEKIGGQARRGLALLNTSDGSATSWAPGNEERPESMYLSPGGGALYLGIYGRFSIEPNKINQFNEPYKINHGGVAALQLASEVTQQPTVLPFAPDFVTPGEFSEVPVTSFVQIGSTLYIGGRFVDTATYEPSYSEERHIRVAAFNTANNYEVVPFEPAPNGEVTALAANEGHLYIAGNFGEVAGAPRLDLAEVNATTAALEGGNPKIDGRVDSLAVTGSGVYVAGSITTVGGATRDDLAAINTSTGALEELDPGVDGPVYSLAASGAQLYVGGSFRNATGSGEEAHSRSNLAAFETSNGTLTSFDPEPNSTVSALALSDTTLFAGGSFSELRGVAHGSLAAFSTADGSTEAFDPKPNGGVNALTVSSGRLYAAGSFSQLSGLTGTPERDDLAAFDLPGETLDSSFVPPSFDGSLFAVAANGSTVYAGGDYNDVGSTYQPRLASLSAADGSLQSWNPEVSNDVDSLLLDGSTLYAGGEFGNAGGAQRPGVAGLSTATGGATPFDPQPGSDVRALALGPSALYIGGTFTEVGGVNDSYFATFLSGSLAEEEARPHGPSSGSSESSSQGSDAGATSLASTPSTFITASPAYYTTVRKETFAFSSNVEGASYRCSMDGGASFACSSPYTTGTLALGAHSFQVQAVSPAGAVDAAGAKDSFIIVASAVASPADTAPRLTHVKVPPLIMRGARSRSKHAAAAFTFSLSKTASVRIALRRIESVRCPKRKRGHCTRTVPAGTITLHMRAGTRRVSFSGSVGGHPLLGGRYRATLVATDAAAVSSKPVSVSFRLVARG